MDSQETRSVDTFITELLDINKQLEARLAQLEANEGTVFSLPVAIIQDQKAANTAGGTATSGSWFTRTLNTVVSDPDGIVGLASNQITLQAGTYLIEADIPAVQVDRHKARLRNITAGTTLAVGVSAFVHNAVGASTLSVIRAFITLAAATVLEIQHRVNVSQATYGLGLESGAWGEVEVYTQVKIIKFN